VARNLSSPHEFHCFTDSAYDYARGIIKRPLPQDGLRGWWNKLALFKPGLFPDGARVLYLDLDTLITGSLDEIAAYAGEFAMLGPFFDNVSPMFAGPQSGVMGWGAGFGGHIWQTYVNTDYPDLPGGDQAFLRHVHPSPDLWQNLFPGQVVSFKALGAAEPHADTRIVCFHGLPRPHEATQGWVLRAWSGGMKPFGKEERLSANATAPIRAAALIKRLPDGPVTGVEVGVFSGLMSRELLMRPGLFLHMVDSWEGNGEAYTDKADWHASLDEQTQLHYMNRALFNTEFATDRRQVHKTRSLNAATYFGAACLDFVFLDADHSAEACKADLEAWWPKVKLGGLIAGHDYGHRLFPEVKTAVDQFVSEMSLLLCLDQDGTWFATKPKKVD